MKKIITPSAMRNYLRSEPVLSNASDALLKKIHSMEPHIAYALLGVHYEKDDNDMLFEILSKDANLKGNRGYDTTNELLIERL